MCVGKQFVTDLQCGRMTAARREPDREDEEMEPVAGDGSVLPTPGKYLQNFATSSVLKGSTLQCHSRRRRRRRADTGALCFTTLRGCCSTRKSHSPASSPGLRSAAEPSTEENWDERSFCQSLVPILWQLAGTLHVPVEPQAPLAASAGRDGQSDPLTHLFFPSQVF